VDPLAAALGAVHRLVRGAEQALGLLPVVGEHRYAEAGFQRSQLGFGSAVAVILFIVSIAFALLYQRFLLRRDLQGSMSGGVT